MEETKKKKKKKLKKKRVEVELGEKRVSIEDVIPNDWNPNKMDPGLFGKLVHGIDKLLEGGSKVPPITVRPHPERHGAYQIIDGAHRHRALKRLGQESIDVFVIDVNDAMAKILTTNLNYLRGQADDQLYGELLGSLVRDNEMTLPELQELLPESSRDILTLMDRSESASEVFKILDEQRIAADKEAKERAEEAGEDEAESLFVDLKFTVSAAAAKVIESEIDRIETRLSGRNRRGRALEFMAVMSAQTPESSLEDTLGEDNLTAKVRKKKAKAEEEPPKKKKLKKKLKKKRPVEEEE